jgi:hypothetical protein
MVLGDFILLQGEKFKKTLVIKNMAYKQEKNSYIGVKSYLNLKVLLCVFFFHFKTLKLGSFNSLSMQRTVTVTSSDCVVSQVLH